MVADVLRGGLTNADVKRFKESLELNGPNDLRTKGADYAWYPVRDDVRIGELVSYNYMGKTYVLLSNKRDERFIHESKAAGGKDWELTSARPGCDSEGGPAVLFTFDAIGARLMGDLTSSNQGRQLAILVDNEMYSAPNIAATITDRGIITGNFTIAEVRTLCETLTAK